MNTDPYSVLIVDDSAMMRNLVGRIVESDERTTVAGKAMNGRFALRKIESLRPEVIVLDLEMPEMNGIEFLQERRTRRIDIPVIVLSSVATKGARITMEALSLGASDFILKPSGSVSTDIHAVADQLLDLIVALGAEYRGRASREHGPSHPPAGQAVAPAPAPPVRAKRPPVDPGPIDLVAIGVSTGGPNALRKMLALVPGDLPCPIVVVQHMPAGFTTEFAASLDRVCRLTVREASDGDRMRAGFVYVAPGDHHLTVASSAKRGEIRVDREPPRNGHRPSADVLFASVAAEYGKRAMGVIMTGMGRDGAAELGSILRAGGITIGQDAATSVVYGMPRVAYELGHVERQVPLAQMAQTISRLVREHR